MTPTIKTNLGNFEYRFTRKEKNGELILNDVWDECIWHTISRAKGHFETCNVPARVTYAKRKVQVQLLDRIAFHEAFLNALVHRDYSIDGMVIVEFNGNELIISSPGTFYGGVSPENIFQHEPRHRNKSLAKMLMEYHLVDRAGMGIFRISLNSLRYGREFPSFAEKSDSVVVRMQAEYFRAPVFIMSEDHKDVCGIPEFILLNAIYATGHIRGDELEKRLGKLDDAPWNLIQTAVTNLPCVELCGDKSGVFVRVQPAWNKFFKVQKTLRASSASPKYVKLYNFLKTHGSAPNCDINSLLEHPHTSQTSVFLRDASFVERIGKGRTATWSLKDK